MALCRLCQEEGVLVESHIIPKFFGVWLKNTSATGYIRVADTPNRRSQDLWKCQLLCKSCEDIFSNDESYFADKIFHPYHNKKNSVFNFVYNNQLARFCASLSWRALIYLTEVSDDRENFEIEELNEIEKAKLKLQKFMLKDTNNLEQYEQHLLPTRYISDFELNVPNVNFYMERTVGLDLLSSSNGMFVYIKLPYFILLSNINYKYVNRIRGSRVSLKNGNLMNKEFIIPIEMKGYLENKLEYLYNDIFSKISDTQKNKIFEKMKSDPDRLDKSGTLKAIQADFISQFQK